MEPIEFNLSQLQYNRTPKGPVGFGYYSMQECREACDKAVAKDFFVDVMTVMRSTIFFMFISFLLYTYHDKLGIKREHMLLVCHGMLRFVFFLNLISVALLIYYYKPI